MQRVCLVVVIAIGLVACGDRTVPPAKPLSATWNAPAIVQHVPRDTPYFFAMLAPLDPRVRAIAFAGVEKRMATAMQLLEVLPYEERADLPPYLRLALALLDELRGTDVHRWGEKLGLHPNGRFVLYGLSVWPVMRYELADPAKLRRVARRVIEATGLRASEGERGGRTYWTLDLANVSLIVAILETEVVIAVMPPSIIEEALPSVLGIARPERSLADTTVIPSLLGKYHLLPMYVGYADIRAAAGIVTQRAPSTIAALDRPLLAAAGPIDPTCRHEVDRVVRLVPRIVMGYRKLDESGMEARMIAELPHAITRALGKLRVAMPEVTGGMSGRSLGSLGIAVDVGKALAMLGELSQDVRDHPFECAWLQPLAGPLAKLRDAPRSLPPAVRALRGVSLVVDDVTLEPLSASGHLLLAGDGANEALRLLVHDLFGMHSVALASDGRPVALPVGMLNLPPAITAHAAAIHDRAVVALGNASVADTARLLRKAAPKRSPLLSLAMDMHRLRELGALSESDDDMSPFGDVALQLDVLPEGLTLDMFVSFADM